LYSLRLALESLSLTLCDQLEPKPDWEKFDPCLTNLRDAAAQVNIEAYAEADLAFHSMFYTLCGHRRLLSVWNQYQPTFSALLKVSNAQDSDLGPSLASHERILSCMVGGKLEDALRELQGHFEDAARRIRQSLRNTSSSRGG
jgi:GntR family transcriptional regulator of gluconate operon